MQATPNPITDNQSDAILTLPDGSIVLGTQTGAPPKPQPISQPPLQQVPSMVFTIYNLFLANANLL